MFTGIIESTGTIVRLDPGQGTARLAVSAPAFAHRLRVGDSIAVNGTCLTALVMEPPVFYADLAAETLARTTLGQLAAGTTVNLELPTPAGAPLGGHVVQGHVDGCGTIVSFDPVNATADPDRSDWWLRIRLPENIRRYVVEKGSIAVEGISLTVAAWDGEVIGIAILPHTRNVTNLRTLKADSRVNIEADVMLRLAAEQQRAAPPSLEVTLEYLLTNGF